MELGAGEGMRPLALSTGWQPPFWSATARPCLRRIHGCRRRRIEPIIGQGLDGRLVMKHRRRNGLAPIRSPAATKTVFFGLAQAFHHARLVSARRRHAIFSAV